MTVSNEDRDTAINRIYDTECFNESVMDEWHQPTMGSAIKIVDTLVSHGWGPKATVSADKVCEDIDCCGRTTVIIRLRECGIEVTDGG